MKQLVRDLQSAAGFGGNDELRGRLYTGICLLVGGITLGVILPFNAFLVLPLVVNIIVALFGASALGLYLLARRGHRYPGALLAFALAALAGMWFPNGGPTGSIPLYFFPALLYPVMFFTGRARAAGLAATLATGGALIGLDLAYPGLTTPYQSPGDRAFDQATGLLLSGSLCVVLLWVVAGGFRREQERLAESRAVLSAMIDSTDDIVCLVEPDAFRLRLFNRAFAGAIARSQACHARVGQAAEEILGPWAAADWLAFFRRAVDTGPFTAEYRMPGSDRVFLYSFSPVRHAGTLVGIAMFGKDITSAKHAEEKRVRMAQGLLESQRLESLGSLAGGVAHDFNNMLAGIMGYADLLLVQEADPGRRDSLQAIVQAAARSSELAGKMLAFARRGKNVVEAVDLTSMLADSVKVLGPSLCPDVATHIEAGARWTVDADPSQMRQVLLNLCVNANEAMPHGGTLTMRTIDRELDEAATRPLGLEPGPHVLLEVSDTGVGMTEEVKARIFDPFFTTKAERERPGTGLGLSTVHGIVHLHRGAIAVESAPGRGTTFRVYLPRGEMVPVRRAAPAPGRAGRRLVLVADDESMLRDFTSKALVRLGYTALTAGDGVEAVRLFREHHGELTGVLLDLKMPGKDGTTTFREMRALDASVPVLICSGYGDNEEAQELISAGARGLLPKPFRVADLKRELVALGG